MAHIKLSVEAAQKAKMYSKDASQQLLTNINIMDNEVNSQFSGLQDPSFQRYLELSAQMQAMINSIRQKMDSIESYCDEIIDWILHYAKR